jgi:hypothetical protein
MCVRTNPFPFANPTPYPPQGNTLRAIEVVVASIPLSKAVSFQHPPTALPSFPHTTPQTPNFPPNNNLPLFVDRHDDCFVLWLLLLLLLWI